MKQFSVPGSQISVMWRIKPVSQMAERKAKMANARKAGAVLLVIFMFAS
jgi:hypothetical protein